MAATKAKATAKSGGKSKKTTTKASAKAKSTPKAKSKAKATTKAKAKSKASAPSAIKVTFAAIPEPEPWTIEDTGKPAFEVLHTPLPSSLPSPAKILEKHSAFVQALAFSPDGRFLVTGSEDGSIRVWDVDKGLCLHTKTDHSSAVNSVAFTTDGKYLLSGSDDHAVGVWNGSSFDLVRMMSGHDDYVSRVRPAGPGRAVSASKDGTVRLWNIETGECVHVMNQEGGWVFALGASHDGKRAVAGSDRNVIRMWDLATGKVERDLLDASDLFIGEIMGMTLAGENSSGKGHKHAPKQAVFAPDDKTFVTCEGDLVVWESSTGDELVRIEGDGWPIEGIAYIPNRALATASSVSEETERKFLDQLTNEPENQAIRSVYSDWLEERGRVDEANGVRRYGSSRYVFGGSRESVHVFDLVSKSIISQAAWKHGEAKNVAVSPDGRWGACGSDDGVIGIWDLDVLMRAGLPDRHLSLPSGASIAQDGTALTGSSDRMIRLWNKDGKTSKRLRVEEGLFVNVDFTPDGRYALVMNDRGVLRAFATQTGELHGEPAYFDKEKKHASFNEHRFLRDGRMLVASISTPLAIWSVDPPMPPEVFAEDAGHVTAIDVDEDQDLIVTAQYASGEEPMKIHYWSLSKRSLEREILLRGDKAQYGAAAIIAGDRVVITTSEGGMIILDREGEVLSAHQVCDDYLHRMVKLPDGRIVIGGSTPRLVDPMRASPDPREGVVLRHLSAWQDAGRQTVLLPRKGKALVYSNEGVALLDFLEETCSSFTPVPEVHEVAASPDLAYVVALSRRSDWQGCPVVLRT